MRVLSHRGYWLKPIEKNSKEAITRSLRKGFGIETDIRDCSGTLVISHDIPTGSEMKLETLFEITKDFEDLMIALNIKSDGLVKIISELVKRNSVKNYFVFDMSIPDSITYINEGIPVFTRVSEYEEHPIFYEESEGIWVDSFNHIWFDNKLIESTLKNGKKICLVSPELHGRNPYELWDMIDKSYLNNDDLMICTDYPKEINEYLGMTDL